MSLARQVPFALTRPLDLGSEGPRVAVKECLGIAGLPTRCGSPALAGREPETAHCDAVAAVLEAGCRIVGTANMHELAFGVTGVNRYLGTPTNPGWPDRIPGGSSSGSAALVAAGACDFALGTDTGGSIRMPAACCGVFGMKPTFGRVARKGALPADSSLDCIGPLAPSAALLTRAMECLDPGFVREDAAGPFRLRSVAVAVAVDPDIRAAFDAAMAGLDAPPVDLPHLRAAYEAGLVVINWEVAEAFGELALGAPDMDPAVRSRILAAVEGRDAEALARAEDTRTRFRAAVDAALEGVDALVLPTLPVVPPTLEGARDMMAVVKLTELLRPFNLSGHPALTIPIRTADGLPAGIQLVGRFNEDARLCAVAQWLADRLPTADEIMGDVTS